MKTLFILLSFLAMASSFAQSLDASFNGTSGTAFTDQQMTNAQSFVHQGLKDKKIEKGCEELKSSGGCSVSGIESKGTILPAMIENNIGKLYTLLFGGLGFLSGKGPKVTVKDKSAPADATKSATPGAEKTKNQKSDYCLYGAMGYEVIAMGMQSAMQQNAQNKTSSIQDSQVAALVNLKETHLARKKTATYQSAVYGATFACYAARAALSGGSIVMDTSYIAKMTAAAGIAVLYKMKASKEAKAAQLVQKVIDSLPKAGDCNPWTGTSCFCSEKTSQTLYPSEYQEVCVLKTADAATATINTGCAQNVAGSTTPTYDPDCSCKANNTCFMATVKTFTPNFSLGANLMNDANKAYQQLSSGTLNEGALGDISDKMAAISSKLNPKIDTSEVPKVTPTAADQATADGLGTLMPQSLANVAASAPASNPSVGGLMGGSSAAALEKLPAKLKDQLVGGVSGKYSNNGGSIQETPANPEITLPQLPGQGGPQGGVEVMDEFSQKAIDNNADVTSTKDTPIFDIISNRYRRSAWNQFPVAPATP